MSDGLALLSEASVSGYAHGAQTHDELSHSTAFEVATAGTPEHPAVATDAVSTQRGTTPDSPVRDNAIAPSPPMHTRSRRTARPPTWRVLEDAAATAELARLQTFSSKRTRACEGRVIEGVMPRTFSSWAMCDRCNKWRKDPTTLQDEAPFECAMLRRQCCEPEDEMSCDEEWDGVVLRKSSRSSCARPPEGEEHRHASRKQTLVASQHFSVWAMCDACSKWRKLSCSPQDEAAPFQCSTLRRLCAEPEDEMSSDEEWDETRVAWTLDALVVLVDGSASHPQPELAEDAKSHHKPLRQRSAEPLRSPRQLRRPARSKCA